MGQLPMNSPRTRFIALMLVVGGLFLLQCAAIGGRGRGGSSFDALGFPGDDTVLTAGVPVRTADDDDEDLSVIDNWGTITTDDASPVLRVQFFATTSLAEAEDMKRRASKSLEKSVSIDFETPYYKLKVGPLKDEDAAERLVVRLRAMGYESAWIVRERADGRTRNR
jgi:hypothetical protein